LATAQHRHANIIVEPTNGFKYALRQIANAATCEYTNAHSFDESAAYLH